MYTNKSNTPFAEPLQHHVSMRMCFCQQRSFLPSKQDHSLHMVSSLGLASRSRDPFVKEVSSCVNELAGRE